MQDLRNLLSRSIAVKLGTSFGLLLLMAILTVLGVFLFVSQQSQDSEVIDVAGRQRMLTQRMSKLALLIQDGQGNLEIPVENGADVVVTDALALAAERYGTSLQALIDGAGAVASADLVDVHGLAGLPAATGDVRTQLEENVIPTWQSFSNNIDTVLTSSNADAIDQAISQIVLVNEDLLVESNTTVQQFVAQSNQTINNLQIFLIVILVLDVLVLLYAIRTIRQIINQTQEMGQLVTSIDAGDYEARAEVMTDDELGRLAGAFNGVLANTLSLIQSEDEKQEIQISIMKLLDEVSTVADGDLTVEAEVTDSITGAIADSFNFMIEQLRMVISDVKDATLQVSSSANEIQTTAEHLSLGSEAQATQIIDTSAAIDEMSVSIQQVSENAALSATVGEQARANAEKGAEAVRNTIQGMTRIRSQVQDTTRRIRRLGDSSQRIGEIVELIDDIADRTSILALNASIQAELAGEAGRSFAVVAEEVERLAERSTQATQQISVLIRNIQSEMTEVIAAMESTNDEVEQGERLANDAGGRLTEIQSVSARLSELIQSISLAAKQQARGSETIARSMGDISEVTQQTAAGTKQATVSIGNLARLADELRSSVSTFQLPSSNGQYA